MFADATTDRPTTPTSPRAPRRTGLLAALVLLAAAFMVVRGPVRSWQAINDFGLLYSASRAWLLGDNPYDASTQLRVWTEAARLDAPPHTVNAELFDALYPPVTYVCLAPLAALPWWTASALWTGLNAVLAALMLGLLVRLFQIPWASPRAWALVIAGLCFAPLHTTLAFGHLIVAIVALLATWRLADRAGRPACAGLALGLAIALKPQLAGLFVLIDLADRRWTTLLATGLTVAALAIIAVARLELAGVPWLDSYRQGLADFARQGGVATLAHPMRFTFIHLGVVLHAFTDSRLVVTALGWLVTAAGLGVALWRRGRPDDIDRRALALGLLAVITLLPVYHRYYDALLLLLPLAWAARAWPTPQRRWAWPVVLLIAPLFVPGAAVLNLLADRARLPDALADSAVFHRLILPHQAWLIFALAVVMTLAAWRGGASRRSHAPDRAPAPS